MATITVTPIKTFVSGETVTPAKLNDLAESTVALTAGSIVAADIASNAVTTAKILDANVTNAKLASGIDASKLTTGTLPIARIADGGLTAAKLASNAVETAKIADDAVTNAKLSLAANAGEIKKALNADNDPPIYACRAWVNFNGATGATIDGEFRCTINGSGNVIKVVRTGTGAFTVHFSASMPTTNYAVVGAATAGFGNSVINASYNTRNTGSVGIVTGSGYRANVVFGVAVNTETSISVFA